MAVTLSFLIPSFSHSIYFVQSFHPLFGSGRGGQGRQKIASRTRQLLSLPGGPVSASLNPVESR